MIRIATSPLHALKQSVSLLKRENLETLVSARRTLETDFEATAAFERARDQLLDVNGWGRLVGGGPLRTHFELHDADGVPVKRTPRQGDFICMRSLASARVPRAVRTRVGADWVRVEHCHDDALFVNLRTRPSHDPTQAPRNEAITCHFFTDKAQNHLTLERQGQTLVAAVHGEHEYANVELPTAGTEGRALRNGVMAQLHWGVGRPTFGSTPGERLLRSPVAMNTWMWQPFVERISGNHAPATGRTGGFRFWLRRPRQAGFKGPFGFVIPRAQ